MTGTLKRVVVAAVAAVGLSGCAGMGLGTVLLAPTFAVDGAEPPQLRLMGPSMQHPLGAAAVRIQARVGNPNPVGLTLTRLAGDLRLEGRQAARVDFPLGLPLQPGSEAVVPLELVIDFNDIPGVVDVLRRAVTGGRVGYALDGTVGVDAGLLGQPVFGPMLLLEGDLRVAR